VTDCLCWPPNPADEPSTLPTPCARDSKGPGHDRGLPDVVPGLRPPQGSLLPTPTVADSRSSANTTANRLITRVGHGGMTLTDAARLLPTPRSSDGAKGCPGQRGSHGDLTLPSAAVRVLPTPTRCDGHGGPGGHRGGGPNLRTTVATLPTADEARWGVYAAAVAQWEVRLGRRVPEPTQLGVHGKPVLAPRFVECLMGLDESWVTGLQLPRTHALRVLGNGVVPQQAAVALRLLLCPHRWWTSS
jgi:hypothetical protein